MSETIRVGVIGAGTNTTLMHIPGFQAIDGVEVVSVANRSRESGQRVADQFGIPNVGRHVGRSDRRPRRRRHMHRHVALHAPHPRAGRPRRRASTC